MSNVNRRDGVRGGPRRKPRLCGMASWIDGDLVCYEVALGTRVHLVIANRFTRVTLAARKYDCWLYRDLILELGGDLVAKYIDQVKAAGKAVKGEIALQDGDFSREYPATFEFVSETKNSDGTQRQTATLLFFAEAGCWKVCLGDRESGLSLWAAGETFIECLECLEALLTSGNPQWRQGTKRSNKKP